MRKIIDNSCQNHITHGPLFHQVVYSDDKVTKSMVVENATMALDLTYEQCKELSLHCPEFLQMVTNATEHLDTLTECVRRYVQSGFDFHVRPDELCDVDATIPDIRAIAITLEGTLVAIGSSTKDPYWRIELPDIADYAVLTGENGHLLANIYDGTPHNIAKTIVWYYPLPVNSNESAVADILRSEVEAYSIMAVLEEIKSQDPSYSQYL